MDIEKLKSNIEKKEAQIEKIKKRIAKHESHKAEDFFARDFAGWYVDAKEVKKYKTIEEVAPLKLEGDKKFNPDYTLEDALEFVKRRYEDHIKDCDNEIKWANRDLEDALTTLNKYKNALKISDEKASTEKIQVIVDFLNNWKADARTYLNRNLKWYEEYLKANRKLSDFENYGRLPDGSEVKRYLGDSKRNPEFLEKANELKEEVKRISEMVHPWTIECKKRTDSGYVLDDVKVAKILDEEAERKYWDMINKVTKITGEINDASSLRIGPKGNLEGVIIGANGKCKLETIIAGGENAGVIVNVKRGPIAHYRTLCTKLKN